LVFVSEPQPFVADSDTLYNPGVLYVITGFWLVLADGDPPGNVHDQEVGELVELSVKVTLPPASTEVVEPVKSVRGATIPVPLTATFFVVAPVLVCVIFPE
jgi:hypothetical protein